MINNNKILNNDILKKAGVSNEDISSFSFSVAKMLPNKEYIILYECIADIREAYILAQHEMTWKADNELIFIFPGFNNSNIKSMVNFDNYVNELIKKYEPEKD